LSLKEAIRNEPEARQGKLEEEHEKQNGPSTDLYADIRRLDSIIRRLNRRIKKIDNDEMLVKLSNAVGLMTSKKCDLVCIVLKVEELVKGKTYYRPK